METVVCFMVGVLVCGPVKLDRPRGDFEPIILKHEKGPTKPLPFDISWRLTCPNFPNCTVYFWPDVAEKPPAEPSVAGDKWSEVLQTVKNWQLSK